ncbi:hypothetical protein B0T10DRAFT_480633 [Thelonectria olida]|uniref:Uncharacterized protein n=1 Tax=Thelonectria olida TaxID=1576542 RepID=A0A9P8WAZ2_9HYPO|nr:hypothetical protein B0T10DRAFT_480633 [Thelonectria olida]
MEESAPKRRRTSPRTSLEIGATASPEEQATTTRHKRPSFASPTKASLARHNPQILERRRSQSPQKGPATGSRAQQLAAEAPEESPSELLAKQLANSVLASELAGTDESEEPTPTEARQARRSAEGLPSVGRTANRPIPRPLPPPGSDDEDNPFLGRALRRSPLPDVLGGALPAGAIPDGPEPELPPSVPDTISSTPARGIHSSPLSYRSKRRTTSPKPHQPPAPENESGPSKTNKQPMFGKKKERTQETAPTKAPTASPRKTRVLDSNAEKKKERDDLLREIEALKKDLGTAQRENERIRAMHQLGRVLAPSDPDGIVNLISRQSASLRPEPKLTASQILVKATMNPIGLLPFGKPQPPILVGPDEIDESSIKSHHPVQLTADEELPYLELFSPFSITSNLSVLPKEADEPLRQLHSIILRSREFPGFFTSKVDLTVNAMDLTILDMDVAALEPAAKGELGPFIDKVCSGDCNRTMQRNIGIVSWAMGEWVRVAVERAAFWCHLGKRLGSRDAVLEASEKMRAKKSRKRKDGEDEFSSEAGETLSNVDLIRYLGQQWFEVPIPDDESSSVRFEWKIGFDWTGEAQSQLTVLIGFPGKWHQTDERESLSKIPQLFAELVDGGEKLETVVRTVVALLTGDVAR